MNVLQATLLRTLFGFIVAWLDIMDKIDKHYIKMPNLQVE